MAEEMTNIEIRDFQTVSGATDNDYVVLSLSDGTSAKMAVGLFTSSVASGSLPSIKDGVWWIGTTDTGVQAEGKTPELRHGELGVEYKYTGEGDDAWRLLVPYEEIRLNFDELTEAQRDQLRMKYSDLTPEEIAELQKPANDMIAVLEETNADIQTAEEARREEFERLKGQSEAATASAQDTADHPTYVGEDNYVYSWNKQAQSYDKTSVYVKGEAFSIKKVYSSIDEMYSDTTSAFKEGDFCLINTGSVEDEANAQVFVRNASGSWDFLVDMSGAVGFTGKTPQMMVGTVDVGSGKDSASVTVSPDGTDADGNPRYRINYVIPCLAYEDLTEGQIADLQRPASDMIARLQTTDDSVTSAERLRVEAEDQRAREFTRLKEESETATSNAVTAEEGANAARDAANEAAQSASGSAEKADAAAANADAAAQRANASVAGAQQAAAQADTAAQSANEAAEGANVSSKKADDAASGADEAAAGAKDAANSANVAADAANAAAQSAASATDAASEAAGKADASAGRADTSATGANEAADKANAAAEDAKHLPKIQDGTWWIWNAEYGEYRDSGSPASGRSPMIQNGTWWTWDDALGEYTDTGQSVSAEYQLTKEKIEGVFTGDISTHTHTHLIYNAQVYEEVPDFTSLVSWTDGNGAGHDYVLGNDIYVKDADEMTGYANYRLARTVEGNAWVKVSQIPEGYRMVLSKVE